MNCFLNGHSNYHTPAFSWLFFINFRLMRYLLYTCHHNPLLVTNRSWILVVHKGRIFWKKILEKKEMDFNSEVINIQGADYNGARIVNYYWKRRWKKIWMLTQKIFQTIVSHFVDREGFFQVGKRYIFCQSDINNRLCALQAKFLS